MLINENNSDNRSLDSFYTDASPDPAVLAVQTEEDKEEEDDGDGNGEGDGDGNGEGDGDGEEDELGNATRGIWVPLQGLGPPSESSHGSGGSTTSDAQSASALRGIRTAFAVAHYSSEDSARTERPDLAWHICSFIEQ